MPAAGALGRTPLGRRPRGRRREVTHRPKVLADDEQPGLRHDAVDVGDAAGHRVIDTGRKGVNERHPNRSPGSRPRIEGTCRRGTRCSAASADCRWRSRSAGPDSAARLRSRAAALAKGCRLAAYLGVVEADPFADDGPRLEAVGEQIRTPNRNFEPPNQIGTPIRALPLPETAPESHDGGKRGCRYLFAVAVWKTEMPLAAC